MHYRVLASGPIIRGNGTLPRRLVLLAWGDRHVLTGYYKLSVHTQEFNPPQFPKKARFTSLTGGSYFTSDDKEIEAPLVFAEKLKRVVIQFWKDINIDFVAEEYDDATEGDI